MSARPLKFAKRYALVDENEYSSAIGRKTASTLPDPLADTDAVDARRVQRQMERTLDDPFLDDQRRLQEHSRLLRRYLDDLERIRERERRKLPPTLDDLRTLTRDVRRPDLSDDGVDEDDLATPPAKRLPRTPASLKKKPKPRRTPRAVRRIRPIAPGLDPRHRRRDRKLEAERALEEADIYESDGRGFDRMYNRSTDHTVKRRSTDKARRSR